MKLYLKGHDYKYAVEQIMLTMFPNERPDFTGEPHAEDENFGMITLGYTEKFASATTVLTVDGVTARANARVAKWELDDKYEVDRLLQKVIKQSFYKAAMKITGNHPVWGCLTGIRPAKLAANMMEKGMTPGKVRVALENEYGVYHERALLCMEAAVTGMELKKSLSYRDIALYVGIPFCPTRCAYCSFVSHSVEKSMKLVEPFLAALKREIAETARVVKELDLNIRSVYIGGGTPTTLSADQLAELIAELHESFELENMVEFCVEAGRADTIDEEKLRVMKDGGVTRISINPQTMSDTVLEAIGRRHTSREVLDAYALARSIGFASINMDLIAGLPTDSVEGFKSTLDTLLELDPENITIHTLSLKKGTRITLEGTTVPNEKAVGEMLDYALQRLTDGGYKPYYLYRQKFMSGGFENIGWSRDGTDSFYNIAIMEELCTVIAMGGGASTKLVAPDTGKIERIFNAKYPYEYIDGIDKIISAKEYISEFYKNEVLLYNGIWNRKSSDRARV